MGFDFVVVVVVFISESNLFVCIKAFLMDFENRTAAFVLRCVEISHFRIFLIKSETSIEMQR